MTQRGAVHLVSGHDPHQPSWDCAKCPGDKPWPCDTAREELVRLPDRGATRMGALLEQAFADGLRLPAAEMWERFVAWTGTDSETAGGKG